MTIAGQSTSIQIDLLDPHPHNPRGEVNEADVEELVASIQSIGGILEPLLVVPNPNQVGRYLTVCGHRRRLAAKLAGLETVPVTIEDFSPAEQEEIMLTENIQRKDLSLIQEARAYQRLIDSGKIQKDIARKLGISSIRIQQSLILLKLSAAVQEMYDQGELPITAAPLLAKIESLDRQVQLARIVASRQLTVPKLEEIINRGTERVQTDKAVEKSRSSGTEKRRAPSPAEIYTRADAVRDLESRNGQALTFADLLSALEDVCKKCGMKEHPEICNVCPLPQLINNLVKRDG